ncbi:MAG: hypothetical protein NTV34_21440 [Proteobacteria bacterium]|nr:hypothetical protein [Pseudomonadota bacterium]
MLKSSLSLMCYSLSLLFALVAVPFAAWHLNIITTSNIVFALLGAPVVLWAAWYIHGVVFDELEVRAIKLGAVISKLWQHVIDLAPMKEVDHFGVHVNQLFCRIRNDAFDALFYVQPELVTMPIQRLRLRPSDPEP